MRIGVISANFKGSGEAPVLRTSFIQLRRTYRNIFLSFKMLKGMSPPDDFVLSNVEITSRTYLKVTGRNEKVLIVMYLLLIFFTTGVAFVLINNT